MERALADAARAGCDRLWLGVWEHNPKAMAFYKKFGFEVVGTQAFMLGNERQRDLVMSVGRRVDPCTNRARQPLLARRFPAPATRSHLAAALVLIVGSIAIGMAGYMHFEALSALDAFLEASMLLGGMGPLHAPKTDAGKLFAAFFALYAGLVFIATAALVARARGPSRAAPLSPRQGLRRRRA